MLKKILIVFLVALGIALVLVSTLESSFDEKQWKEDPLNRYKMSKDIVESRMLIGKNTQEVSQLLGMSDASTNKGKPQWLYRLGKSPSFFESKEELLVVIFTDSLVTKVVLTEE
jgi:hypothetical protein